MPLQNLDNERDNLLNFLNELEVKANAIGTDVVFVNGLEDLPEAVDGVITLAANTSYYITGNLDLNGSRLETGGIVTLFGTSSETSSLTSTGLPSGTPLLTSRYTLPVRFITFKNVDTAIYIDDNGGANAPLALDWYGVNFLNVTNIGEVGTVDNFIYDTGAFISSQNLKFTGSVGTVGFNNSLFQGDGSALPIFDLTSTAVISRRFRTIYSSLVVFGSNIGYRVNAATTIPIEGFILDTINFSGGATYLSGIDTLDEAALFVNCKGVLNTSAIAQLYMKLNATATDVLVIEGRYPAAGTTETTTGLNQKFTHIQERNSLRYDSTIPRVFRVVATFTALSGQNNVLGFYLGKISAGNTQNADADRLTESEIYITASGTRPDAGAIQTFVEMEQNDELYFIVQNRSATTDITVEFLNITVERTN